jgi:hypothetical protein
MRLYSVYYTFVVSSTCFGGWHPSSGARTTVITASGTGQLGLLPSAHVVELFQLNISECYYSCTSSRWWVSTPETCRADYRSLINWKQSHLVGQLFNLIHYAQTHEYKILKTLSGPCVWFHSFTTYILFPFSLKCYKILYLYWVTNSGDMLAHCLRNLSFFL